MMQKLKFFHRAPNGIRSDGGRNLIGRRTQSDRAADGIRLDGGRERWKDVEGYGAESEKKRTIRRRLRH